MKAKIELFGICGIDISKLTFDCCFLVDNNKYYNTFTNDIEGFNLFLNTFNMFNIDKVGFEATGTYHKNLEKFLIMANVKPFLLSPKRVHSFAKSQYGVSGKQTKAIVTLSDSIYRKTMTI